jgi:hypothetical protein
MDAWDEPGYRGPVARPIRIPMFQQFLLFSCPEVIEHHQSADDADP